MLQCGLLRSNLAFAMVLLPSFVFSPSGGTQSCFQHFRAAEAGAGEGNRTLVISLEGFCSTIELHPPSSTSFVQAVPRACCGFLTDSVPQRRKVVEGVGFEPT